MRELQKINYGRDLTNIANLINTCSTQYSILDIFGIYIYTLLSISTTMMNDHTTKHVINNHKNGVMGSEDDLKPNSFTQWYSIINGNIHRYNNERHYVYDLNNFDFNIFTTFKDRVSNCYNLGEREILKHNGEKTFRLYDTNFFYNINDLDKIKVKINIDAIIDNDNKMINSVKFVIINTENNDTASTSFEYSMNSQFNEVSIIKPIEIIAIAFIGLQNELSKDVTKFELSLLKAYKDNNLDSYNLLYSKYNIIFEDMDLFNSDSKYIANLNNPDYKIANSKYRSNIDELIANNSLLLSPKKD